MGLCQVKQGVILEKKNEEPTGFDDSEQKPRTPAKSIAQSIKENHYKYSIRSQNSPEKSTKKKNEEERFNRTIYNLHERDKNNLEIIKAEKWGELNPNIDINKFLIIYPQYSEDREIFLKAWPKDILEQASPMDPNRDCDSCISPELKFKIRKYHEFLYPFIQRKRLVFGWDWWLIWSGG